MTSASSQRFIQQVSEGVELFEKLHQLLEEELSIIVSRDLDALNDMTQRKHQVLREIESSILERNQSLTLLGFTPSEDGFKQLCSTLPSPERSALIGNWTQLTELLREIRLANERNEQVVSRNKANVEQLLNLLQGQHTTNSLYDQQGSKGNYSAQRRIGKA
ncbi:MULTISPECIES: flagella synthesis protein FlgN [Nitrincola]|uniref:FlgN protein n=1 Tax=Nitrincola nitratireducens TaxID=1229521 RepID=W9UR09_9GAMM|nr:MULTISPECIES: flagellar protein FlgN [Nitrincola]EXJ09519.1 FlgN protein [Nitrincola nitratireducens]